MDKTETQMITGRFVEAAQYLLSKKIAKNQSALAKSIDTESTTLSLILGGKRDAPLKTVLKMCELFDINTDWMLWGRGNMIALGINKKQNIQDVTASPEVVYKDKSARELAEILKAEIDAYQKRKQAILDLLSKKT